MRGYTTPPYMSLLPGKGPRSMRATRLPARASTSAAQDPAGPAPTTMATRSARLGNLGEQLRDDFVGIADDGEIGELHHRTMRVDVHADDVLRLAEAARVLHRAADAERDVERRIDDHACGADLSFMTDPATVGDDTRGAHRRIECG